MPSYMIENPKFEPYKSKKRYNYSASMLFFLLSIFTYVLIFYVFEVSPSSIFNNTKILFFISNTLILIIAVDYGAFTDKESHDFYGEYKAAAMTMRSRADNYSPIPVLTYRETSKDGEFKNPKDVEIKKHKEDEEPIVKEIACVFPPEKIVRVVNEEKPREEAVTIEEYKPIACDARKHVNNPKLYGRSKSDKPRREKWENVEEESEEFSKMSNEELNRRVEEFIQRFNREIKLQSRVSST
ncbi:hypothetical protein V5N11_016482 [Cardamine amara subsp. amara]